MLIKAVSAETIWPLRHQVMWPTMPLNFVKLENNAQGKHYAIFVNEKIVSCISLFVKGDSAQFRKLATQPEHQGKGYATALINHVIDICNQEGVKKLWCNARVDKTDFYKNFGLTKTQKHYLKEHIEFVVLECIL